QLLRARRTVARRNPRPVTAVCRRRSRRTPAARLRAPDAGSARYGRRRACRRREAAPARGRPNGRGEARGVRQPRRPPRPARGRGRVAVIDLAGRIEALPPERRRAFVTALERDGERYGVYPLTAAQRRMWLLSQLRPESPVY